MESLVKKVQQVDIASLTPFPGNARRGDVPAIAASLQANGQFAPLVVQASTRYVLSGNHTMQAAQSLGWTKIAIVLVDVDDDRALRINLAANRTSDTGTYDDRALLELLRTADALDGTGYTPDDVDGLAELIAAADLLEASPQDEPATAPDDFRGGDEADAFSTELPERVVTRPGDIWLLGEHRLMCGDCREPGHAAELLGGASLAVAVTSPPYASQRAYDESSGFRPVRPVDYVPWFEPVAASVARYLAPDGSWFVNIKAAPGADGDWLATPLYVLDLVTTHVRAWGWNYATEFCWERPGMPKRVEMRFKNQFEPVYQFTRGRWKIRPDQVRHWSDSVPVPAGPGTGDTSWKDRQGTGASPFGGDGADEVTAAGLAYPGNRLPTFSGSHVSTGHTAAFPVGLPRFFITAYSDPGDAVYDPFTGSGSTLLAAERAGRTGYGMEISPGYCDVACRRYQQLTGTLPVLESTGKAHDFIGGAQ